MVDPVLVIAAACLGAVIGSYLNVVIHRLPRAREQQFGPRSVCPSCGARIPAVLNLPIVSWFLLRGRTRCCRQPLSVRYPLVEALTAASFTLLALYPPSGQLLLGADWRWTAAWCFALHAYLCANLIANTFIDLEFRILPDRLTKPLVAVGLLGALVEPAVVGRLPGTAAMAAPAAALLFAVAGSATGAGLTWSVRAAANVAFGREAMGLGDVKLMAGVGAFLGWRGALLTFFLGAVFGAVGGSAGRLFTKDPVVAFGPYLAAGAVLTLFCEAPIVVFVTETWPAWQREHLRSPLVLAGVAAVALVLLVLLVRRGRRR